MGHETIFDKMDDKRLKKMYKDIVNDFKTVSKNYSRLMYTTICRVHEIGKRINPKYSIKNNLCKDLGITYERYKHYMKSRNITKEQAGLIEDGLISLSRVLFINQRFPKEHVDTVIKLQADKKLSKTDLLKLKKDGSYLDVDAWDEKYDNTDYRSGRINGDGFPYAINDELSSNRMKARMFFNYHDWVVNNLQGLELMNAPTKLKIYDCIVDLIERMNVFLLSHPDWKDPKASIIPKKIK